MEYNKVTVLPAGVKPQDTPDFVRASEYGDLSCYINPTNHIIFQYWSPTEQLDGMVTAYSSNNPTDEWRLVTDYDDEIQPTKFYFKNGIVNLNIISNGVEYYKWDSTSEEYKLVNTYIIGEIVFLKIRVLTFNVIQIQINDSTWTLRQGRPFIYIQHTYSDISYTKYDIYYHDNTTTNSPADGAVITFLSKYHAELERSTYSNLLSEAQSNGCETGPIGPNEFYVESGAVLAEDTLWFAEGSKSVQCTFSSDTSSAVVFSQGIANDGALDNKTIIVTGTIKGTEGNIVGIAFRDYFGAIYGMPIYVTLTGGDDEFNISFVMPTSANCGGCLEPLIFSQSGVQTISFDKWMVTEGSVIKPWVLGGTTTVENVGIFIVKTAPTSIYSDSIPADDITVIGHYEKDAQGYNSVDNLVKECFIQVTQYAKPYGLF